MSSTKDNDNTTGGGHISPDGVAEGNRTEGGDVSKTDDDDWVDPTPRRRRRKDSKDDKKKKKKTKKGKKIERKSSCFGPGQHDVVGEGDDRGGGRNEGLCASSIDYPLPPPRHLSRKNSGSRHEMEDKKRDFKQLQINGEHDRPSRPGAIRVGRAPEDGDVDIESRPAITDLATTDSSNVEFPPLLRSPDLLGSAFEDDQLRSQSSSDVMAEAEVADEPVIAAVSAPDIADELQDRVAILENTALREGREKQKTKWRKRMLFGLLFLSLMGGTIGVIFFLLFGGKGDDSPTEFPSLSPSIRPSPYPTSPPSTFPSSVPTVDVEEMWIALIQSNSPGTTFDVGSSPEYMALDWIVQDPLTRSLFNDTNRVFQRFALAVFWYATGASIGGWLDDRTECDWGGRQSIRCDGAEALTFVSLENYNLAGTIPRELGLLTSLSHLGLLGNAFVGTVPTELGKLTDLTFLDISYSPYMEGTIPSEVGLLTALTLFGFSQLHLEGTLPTEAGMMSNADVFIVFQNKLANTIPSEIGLMTSVRFFDIAENDFSGTIPSEVVNLTNLEALQMYENDLLSGTIPSSLCAPARTVSIDCEGDLECTCCSGAWPTYEPCQSI